ncbi:MAG: hypothetical protein ABFD90_21295 [Phycisphaerales bacterium]
MSDVLRVLFCGVGMVYLVVRVGGHLRSLVRGYRMAIAASEPDDGFRHPGPHPRMHARDTASRVSEQADANR